MSETTDKPRSSILKTIAGILAMLGVQVAAVLLLARAVRGVPESMAGVGVFIWAIMAYGIPALLVFVWCIHVVHSSSSRFSSRVLGIVVALLVTSFGHCVSLTVLQRTDVWLTWRYIYKMRAQLQADPRFKDVHLICYSDDYILFPYIPVAGHVASAEDRKALDRILKDSHPPAFASTIVVQVGLSPEERASLPHEK